MEHNSSANHKNSSGPMEGAGAVTIFSNSVEKHKLMNSHYIGDEDTSSFKEVMESKPYEK